MAKTPAPKGTAQQAAPSASKQAPASAKKPENQLAQEAKARQTPNKAAQKKLKEEEEDEDDEDDSDDREEMAALTGKGKKTADPEDEEVDEDDEDADQDEDEDEEYDTPVYVVTEHLSFGNQVGICVPAGSSMHVIGAVTEDASFPLHLTSACLGPDAADDDRATIVVSSLPHMHDHDDEEDEEHDHDHEEEIEELVAGTLCKKYAENIQLDLVVDGDFILTNTSAETDVFLTGRLIIGDDDDEEYDEDDYEDEDEEDDDEDMDEEDEEENDSSRLEISDEDEEEEDPAAVKARAEEMRKRLLSSGSSSESKKSKTTAAAPAAAPKVIDVKPAEKKPAAAAAAPAKAGGKGEKVSAEALTNFVLGELKTKKSIKNTELGTLIANKFGTPFKAMGFEEKSLVKFLEAHAKGKLVFSADIVKLA